MASSIGINSTNGGGVAVVLDNVNDQTTPSVTIQIGAGPLTSMSVLLALDLSNSTAL